MEHGGESIFTEFDSYKLKYRTLFISDLHLGSKGFQHDQLIDFLKQHSFEKIYIVGDFIDGWKLKRSFYWPQRHTDVVRKILRRSKQIPVILTTGNHDEFCENFYGEFGNITICETDIHTTATGKKLLVLHGHQFDTITKHAKFLSFFGDVGYSMLLFVNRFLNKVRRALGLKYWSLSKLVKAKVKDAVNFVSRFENAVVKYAEKYDVDGVLCGHIHTPDIKRYGDVEYYNCGDWVESCTALIEDFNGNIFLIEWLPDHQKDNITKEKNYCINGN